MTSRDIGKLNSPSTDIQVNFLQAHSRQEAKQRSSCNGAASISYPFNYLPRAGSLLHRPRNIIRIQPASRVPDFILRLKC